MGAGRGLAQEPGRGAFSRSGRRARRFVADVRLDRSGRSVARGGSSFLLVVVLGRRAPSALHVDHEVDARSVEEEIGQLELVRRELELPLGPPLAGLEGAVGLVKPRNFIGLPPAVPSGVEDDLGCGRFLMSEEPLEPLSLQGCFRSSRGGLRRLPMSEEPKAFQGWGWR